MMNEREMLLRKISEAQFAAVDLQLYLDSHPNCRAALNEFRKYSDITKKLMNEYNKRFGPLVASDISSEADYWDWVNDPWPWETTRGGMR